jgi:predicted nuclease of predicted toxin-antitoxin system
MKFLLDKNLSFKLKFTLNEVFPGTIHADNAGLESATDREIWQYAANNNFHILTKDNDFDALSNVFGCPPKVVHLTCGNRTTVEIGKKLSINAEKIQQFLNGIECLLKIS